MMNSLRSFRLSAFSRRGAVALAVCALGAGVAVAQVNFGPPPQAPEPTTPSGVTPSAAVSPDGRSPTTQRAPAAIPSAESVLQGLLQEKSAAEAPGVPAAPGKPGEAGAATRPGEPQVLREGQNIDLLTGRLKKNEATGAMEFVFSDENGKGPAYPPMGVVPSRQLAAMEDASEFGQSGMTFRIFAEVTQYRGKNYLYILKKPTQVAAPATMPGAENAAAARAAAMAAGPATQPAGAGAPGVPLIHTVAPNAPAGAGPREGQSIYNRVGRLVRDEKSGTEMFVLDSDGRQMYDPPMGLIPCRNLAVIEDATDHGARQTKFRVSGEVTQYRGKSYIYLKFVQAVRDLNQGLGG